MGKYVSRGKAETKEEYFAYLVLLLPYAKLDTWNQAS